MVVAHRGNKIKSIWEKRRLRYTALIVVPATAAALTVSGVSMASSSAVLPANHVPVPHTVSASLYKPADTTTPIKHLVVIFGENVSFDHYFGTYPSAANTDGSVFHAKAGTPTVNGLTPALLNDNPNEYNPQRLTHSEALTCDQNHSYAPEQLATDGGLMDKFVQNTSVDTCTGQPVLYGAPGLTMDYYDGNTVTAMWNYAQNFAMSDNNYGDNFGPSTPGALNLISGNDGGGYAVSPSTGQKEADPSSVGSLNKNGVGTIYGDLDPAYDDCSDSGHTSTSPVGVMTGQNVGDLLNQQNVTWGWFQGGFTPTSKNSAGYKVCGQAMANVGGISALNYSPHHDPFQYYASTANPQHLPPSSESEIGMTDQANHQYEMSDFYTTLKDGNMPDVSFLKAPEAEDGHPGYSDPLDEQKFVVNTVNQIERSPDWDSTAVVITYDDSDGWYDHQAGPIVNGSNDSSVDTAMCASAAVKLGTHEDRCGFGPRLPLIVISPYTQQNYVSNVMTDQSSVTKFIEDNWLSGERLGHGSFDRISGSLDARNGVLDFNVAPHDTPVLLNPTTGEVKKA